MFLFSRLICGPLSNVWHRGLFKNLVACTLRRGVDGGRPTSDARGWRDLVRYTGTQRGGIKPYNDSRRVLGSFGPWLQMGLLSGYVLLLFKTLRFCFASQQVLPYGHRGGVQRRLQNRRLWSPNYSTCVESPKSLKTRGFRRHPWATSSRRLEPKSKTYFRRFK